MRCSFIDPTEDGSQSIGARLLVSRFRTPYSGFKTKASSRLWLQAQIDMSESLGVVTNEGIGERTYSESVVLAVTQESHSRRNRASSGTLLPPQRGTD